MRISIEHHGRLHTTSLARTLFCVLSACAVVPAIAAPGDDPTASDVRGSNPVNRPAGSVFGYLNIAGSAFHPLDNSTTFTYPGSGCIAKTGGSDTRFVHKVNLPVGAVAQYLRLYYYNTSSNQIVAFFTTYDGVGNFNEVISVSTGGGPSGYNSVLSSAMDFVFAPSTHAINILVNLGSQNDTTLQFCGVRIAYDQPISDRIYAKGFDSISG